MKSSVAITLSDSIYSILSNPIDSGETLVVNTLMLSNKEAQRVAVDVEVYRWEESFSLMKGFSLKPEGTVNAFGNKQFGVFLEPGDQLRVSASVADVVDATCSYYSVVTDQTPQSLALVDGSCPNPDWVLCSDGLTCASSLERCPQSAIVTEATFESMGSTVNISDYFLTDSSEEQIDEPTTFEFQNPGFFYTITGYTGNNPAITVERGRTYNFDFQSWTSGHPIALRLVSGSTAAVPGTTGNNPSNGVRGLGAIVTYTVPMDAPDTLVYQCVTHASMIGTINVVDASVSNYSVTHFSGSTGSQFVVPEEDNFAVFVNSHGGVESSWITGGQTLFFRSDVLTGVGKCECDCVPPENYDIECYFVDNNKKCDCPDGTPSSCTPESCVCDLVLREEAPNRCYDTAQSSSSSSILPSIKVENTEPTGCCCAYEGNRIQCISGVPRSQCNSDHSMMFDIGCVDCGFSWVEGVC